MLGNLKMFRKQYLIIFCIFVLFIISFLFSVGNGSLKLSVSELLNALFKEKDTVNHQIIWNIRLPRTIIAALTGACLSASGVILQGIMRNPLAAPNIIGVSSGGGLAAYIILILYPQFYCLVPAAAFLGALFASLLIYLLAWQNGSEPARLILAGVAVSSFFAAGTNALLVFFPDRVTGVIGFMVGSFTAKTWTDLYMILPYAVFGIGLSFMFTQNINILILGDDIATGVGLNVEKTRFILIGIASLLAACSVSVAGLLGFVGLIVPHISRLLVDNDYRFLLPCTVILGGTTLVLCDTIARLLFDPIEIPVGIIMAFLGAPFFLYLLRQRGENV